jgi:hypothetical protein
MPLTVSQAERLSGIDSVQVARWRFLKKNVTAYRGKLYGKPMRRMRHPRRPVSPSRRAGIARMAQTEILNPEMP